MDGAFIRQVDSKEDLAQLNALWRANSQILGMFPLNAFKVFADNGLIIGAYVEKQLVGYLLFRPNRSGVIRITHLCIQEQHRGQGLARSLVEELIKRFPTAKRLALNCRKDFDVAKLWPRLLFTPHAQKAGKKKGGSVLVEFRRIICPERLPLFDAIEEALDELVTIVLDTNILIDIHDPSREYHEEARGLEADWLVGSIRTCVTPVVKSDALGLPATHEKLVLESVKNYESLEPDNASLASAIDVLDTLVDTKKVERPDIQHMACCLASEAEIFCTRDGAVLEHAEDVFKTTGLRILRPCDVIAHFYTFGDRSKQSFKLHGSGLQIMPIWRDAEIDRVCALSGLHSTDLRTLKSELRNRISKSENYRAFEFSLGDRSQPVGFVIFERSGPKVIVQRLRFDSDFEATRIGRATTDYVATSIHEIHSFAGINSVEVQAKSLSDVLLATFLRRGFYATNAETLCSWTIPKIVGKDLINDVLPLQFSGIFESLAATASNKASIQGGSLAAAILDIESQFKPLKILGGGVPCYIIPIRRHWAQELFDYRLWDRPLLAPDTRLVLQPDSVYYKSSRGGPQERVGRILWYVSGEGEGTKSIRAVSRMTNRVTATAKDLFKRNMHYGVYQWKHMLELAGTPESTVMAISFSDTELLPHPVTFKEANETLVASGRYPQQFQSATSIDESVFVEIYRKGMSTKPLH